MREARIAVDLNELLEDNLIALSSEDLVFNSRGKKIKLKEGLAVKVYAVDLSACMEEDNLIADGIVVLNDFKRTGTFSKWLCRINDAGIYNESQRK
ncbi:MAG: hypothetical protein GZ091_08545 [Paludibacter sp.]|nr:hypothetical protein [Paludibacter sp.]